MNRTQYGRCPMPRCRGQMGRVEPKDGPWSEDQRIDVEHVMVCTSCGTHGNLRGMAVGYPRAYRRSDSFHLKGALDAKGRPSDA